ncbi:MAG: redox-regulated ATPase YchF [Rickettsiales bacterium]|nr:redox-regulated ATPase YchF [Rickettsiales bacterium]|tara:strand:+ start:3872 stop:4966 length:1095 start_codon:yes stop_codon:yes gene_type:complete
MGFNCGIVGLPNVGKSTLFNALLSQVAAEAANYPFCTIEPNTGRVAVPDYRLTAIAELAQSKEILPTSLEFVDIAGLVRGASKGEGLGNQFLSHIREVDAIAHVLRCFEDDDITHVEGGVDPLRDAEIIETELVLADMESLTKRKDGLQRRARGQDKEAVAILALIDKILPLLEEGQSARVYTPTDEEEAKRVTMLQLITSKPLMYVCNVAEDEAATGNAFSQQVAEAFPNHPVVVVSAKIESELAGLEPEEKAEFLKDLGLEETGLARIISEGYGLLNLITFFTAGPKEARAWTVHANAKAPQAAGVIHTDFEKGFIRAETIAFADYVAHKGEQGAKEAGKLRLEGKEYDVKDGDIFHFRFNV